ncbi:synaptonemal complex protein 1-like [Macrobrachium rosenbergii]|uniref:synaptonemal complex protein 1-like n=1 Tax=Macrobrachium rosenbergii TaxID=79674 RepID=UPI0034D54086
MSLHNRTQYITHQNTYVQRPSNRVEVRTMEPTSWNDASKEAGEEVVTIHKKLQQETENIIRWKASSEVNTKQLELQLEESQVIVNDLRRNIMELQLTNENLSQSLIREQEERILINTKVMHTRELVSSLQQQCQELEGTVSVFHQEKQYHCAVQNETIERMNTLTRNFKELSLLSEEKMKVVTDKANEAIGSLQNKICDLERNLEAKLNECNLLTKAVEEFKKEITDLTCKLNLANTLTSETKEKFVQLQLDLDEVQGSLANKLVALQNQMSENLQTKKELQEEQLKLKQSKSEFHEAVEKIKFLKSANNALEGAQSELTEKLEAVTSLKFEIEKDGELKNQVIENLQAEKNRLLEEMDKLNLSLERLTIQLRTKDEHCRTLDKEKEEFVEKQECLNLQLVREQGRTKEFQEKLSSMAENLETMESLVKELKNEQEVHVQLNVKLQQDLQEKEVEVKEKNDEIENFVQKMKTAQETEAQLNENLSVSKNEITTMRENMKHQLEICEKEKEEILEKSADKESSLKNSVEELEKQIEREKKSLAALQTKYENVVEELKCLKSLSKDQKDDLKVKNKKIQQEEKKIEKLEKSMTDSKVNIDRLQEKNKELEEECLNLTKKINYFEEIQRKNHDSFSAEIKALEEELQGEKCSRENLEQELKSKKLEFVSFQNNTNEKMQKMNEDMQKLLRCHQVQIDTLEQEKEKLEKEKQEIEQQTSLKLNLVEAETDEKIKQMADLLARYKSEYEVKLAAAELQVQHLQLAYGGKQSTKDSVSLTERYSAVEDSHHGSFIQKDKVLKSSEIIATYNESKAANSRGRPKIPKMSTAHTEVVDETNSPYQYSKEPFIFKEPPVPKNSSLHHSEEGLGQKESTPSILKSKRSLLPSTLQKHVMFKLPTSCANSGDSSSDACTFEVVDSDDVFEEVMHPGRNRNVLKYRSLVKKPLANVPPMRIFTASDEEINCSKTSEEQMPLSQGSRGSSSCTKTGKLSHDRRRKRPFKTYGVKKSAASGNTSLP